MNWYALRYRMAVRAYPRLVPKVVAGLIVVHLMVVTIVAALSLDATVFLAMLIAVTPSALLYVAAFLAVITRRLATVER